MEGEGKGRKKNGWSRRRKFERKKIWITRGGGGSDVFWYLLHLYYIMFIVEPADPCTEVTCLNGGVCSAGICTCVNGYTGTTCEGKIC